MANFDDHYRPVSLRVHSIPDEITALREIALLLKVAEKTVYTMAQLREVPAFEFLGSWFFKCDDLDYRIEQQKLSQRDHYSLAGATGMKRRAFKGCRR